MHFMRSIAGNVQCQNRRVRILRETRVPSNILIKEILYALRIPHRPIATTTAASQGSKKGPPGTQILISRFIDFRGHWPQNQGESLPRIKISPPTKRDLRRISFDNSLSKELESAQLFS